VAISVSRPEGPQEEPCAHPQLNEVGASWTTLMPVDGTAGEPAPVEWHREDASQRTRLRLGAFAENINTGSGPSSMQVGDRLKIVTLSWRHQIGKECHSRCAVYYAAGDCVLPREGPSAEVVRAASSVSGAPVEVVRSACGSDTE